MDPAIDSPPTITWCHDHIEIIDQTLLPTRLQVIELRSVEEVVAAISRLAVRGAPAIGACGAYGMVLALDERAVEQSAGSAEAARDVLSDAADLIGNARPTAVNLSWAVGRVHQGAAVGATAEEIRRLALAIAQDVFDEDRAACDAIGSFGSRELRDFRAIMTHCNAGRLATTGIGTALGVIYRKARQGQQVEVFASETRPLLQGARLTAWELSNAGIPVTVIPDSAGSSLLRSGRIQAVVVGADRIAGNGDVANKIGTYTHALAAHAAGVPFYVAAPTSTLDPDTAGGADIRIEQRRPDEVECFAEQRTTPAGV
ncbi:MAG: S-methyl-5-thioribose-1-phosphate isomerase, partial [Acidimicrobiales bacterium]